MQINHSPTDLFAGVDNLSLDNRKFDPFRDDIERICRFFSIGKLQHKNCLVLAAGNGFIG